MQRKTNVLLNSFMNLEQRKQAFVSLGLELSETILKDKQPEELNIRQQQLQKICESAHTLNGWFSPENMHKAVLGISILLKEESLNKWLSHYEIPDDIKIKNVGVVMAGNIPAVGFHDFMCVLLAGHKIKVKLSSSDSVLLPALAAMLLAIEPSFADSIHFTSERMTEIDAIIATGSNNSSRYFEYYFGKYPNIIRQNRTSVAVIRPDESDENLRLLYEDIFSYYGMGCRNVTKIYIPENFNFIKFLDQSHEWSYMADNKKYLNNYEYYKAIFLVNRVAHYDNGFLLVKEDQELQTPVAVLHYEKYSEKDFSENLLLPLSQQIQCVVSSYNFNQLPVVPFGKAQQPGPAEYADGVDTMSFLINLNK